MPQDTILIVALGSRENEALQAQLQGMGLHSEIHPHTITAEDLKEIHNLKGIILNGGEDRLLPDGAAMDVAKEIYNAPMPVLQADHNGDDPWPKDSQLQQQILEAFVFGLCGAERSE